MEEKEFWVITITSGNSDTVPSSTAVQIENTASSGTVTVKNGSKNANQTFTISAGQTQMLSGSWLNAEIEVNCDSDSSAQIIYWR